jgi:hypothetical protein
MGVPLLGQRCRRWRCPDDAPRDTCKLVATFIVELVVVSGEPVLPVVPLTPDDPEFPVAPVLPGTR